MTESAEPIDHTTGPPRAPAAPFYFGERDLFGDAYSRGCRRRSDDRAAVV